MPLVKEKVLVMQMNFKPITCLSGRRVFRGHSIIDLTAGIRMAIVPEAFSDIRLTDEHSYDNQEKLIDLLCIL